MSFFPKKKEGSSKKAHQKRDPRVKLSSIHGVRFFCDENGGKEVAIINISRTGLSLAHDPKVNWPPENGSIHGSIEILKRRHKLILEVVHFYSRTVGLKIQSPSSDFQNDIGNHFQAELAAIQLVEVRSDLLQEEADGIPRWFRSNAQSELFLVTRGPSVVRFHLAIFGFHLEGKPGRKLGFGTILSGGDEEEGPLRYKESLLIEDMPALPKDSRELAIRFVSSIELLESGYRDQIVSWIREG